MAESLLRIHTSNRLDVLAEHLARAVGGEPLPPLEREVVVVQSSDMARWLTLRLADRLGVAAGLTLPFPSSLLQHLADVLLDGRPAGDDASRRTPSFDREALTWRLFARLSGTGSRDPRDPTAAYLEDDPTQRKRYQQHCESRRSGWRRSDRHRRRLQI